jgi:hypothetical protein
MEIELAKKKNHYLRFEGKRKMRMPAAARMISNMSAFFFLQSAEKLLF